MRDYLKARVKELGLEGVRVNSAGCLDRCELGPVMVIYPEGIWYGVRAYEDLDEILREHLVGGRTVERLMLPEQGGGQGAIAPCGGAGGGAPARA